MCPDAVITEAEPLSHLLRDPADVRLLRNSLSVWSQRLTLLIDVHLGDSLSVWPLPDAGVWQALVLMKLQY